MASIKDVAKMAGVSVMTASRVLNNNGSVSADARRQVREAVERLGYRPNLTARSLRSRRTRLFGLLLPDIENPIFAALAKHVEEAAGRRGYNVMLGNTWEDPAREAEYFDIMLARQMDGIIVAPVSEENSGRFRACDAPLVVLDRFLESAPELASVTVDNREVGRLAARHLLELGHRHFACIAGRRAIPLFAERYAGFAEEIAAAGKPAPNVREVEVTGKIGVGAEAAAELFAPAGRSRRAPRLPLGLFCANDMNALGAMQAANRLGLSLPDDVSIVGVDGIPAGELATPSLTTVRQPVPDMAAAGVGLLLEMLEGGAGGSRLVTMPPELVVRDSTKRYGRRAPRSDRG